MTAPTQDVRAAGGRRRASQGVGLALGADGVCAVRLRAPHEAAWRRAIAPLPAEGTEWPALASALQELAASLGGGELSVALLPPLAQLRRVELPPLRADELRRVLARNAARWFLGARDPQVTAVETPAGGALPVRRARAAAPGPVPVVAAAASARLVEAVYRAARDAGWTVRTIVPAEAAWRRAALAVWPALSDGRGDVLVHHAGRTALLQLESGRLVGLRHLRAGAADAARVLEALQERASDGPAGPSVSLAALGTPGDRRALADALAPHGAAPAAAPARFHDLPDDAARLAAAFAVRGAGLELVPESLRVARRGRAGRVAGYLGAAAVLLLVVAALLELWGVRRELRAVQAERAGLRAQVAGAAQARASTERRARQLVDLAAADRDATRWAAVLAVLGEHLPDDAYLVALRGRADSVTVEGFAGRAADAVDAVARAPGVAGVRTAAPVRPDLEVEDGLERFTLAARLAPPIGPESAPPAAAPPRRPVAAARGSAP